jgi:UDP-N-acetylglucosamine 2-epimerase (non-hydrolysing)
MKIMTVVGTRPEIIRLSRIIPVLDEFAEAHVLVHTGQNFDERLSGLFFKQLKVREPDVHLGVRSSSFGDQVGQILTGIEKAIRDHRPDRLLILGDTNSGLTALVARRFGIPVYHMEAGNRCFDDRVPEEVNRRVIDHCSTVLMPYTERSRQNLLREGIAGQNIFVTGNPIKEVLDFYEQEIESSRALEELRIEPKKFFLVTLHRSENVDIPERLKAFVDILSSLHKEYGFPVICSFHPRTRARVEQFGVDIERVGLRFLKPLGFFDFVKLEKTAFCLLSDSGTVQEEGCIFQVPNITFRDVTERPETIEGGSNILAGCEADRIRAILRMIISNRQKWRVPQEYLAENVSDTVCRLVLGYRQSDEAGMDYEGTKRHF